jgi:hypothetical protein
MNGPGVRSGGQRPEARRGCEGFLHRGSFSPPPLPLLLPQLLLQQLLLLQLLPVPFRAHPGAGFRCSEPG